MKIKFLGHSCFLLTDDSGTSLLTDPYKSGAYGGALTYSPVTDSADVVVMSHEHEDHAEIQGLPNRPLMIRTAARARGIEFDVVETYHDEEQGKKRGNNRVFCFTLDGIRVCHLGDLGHLLTPVQVKSVGKVDILLIPVGGTFTIGPSEATKVVEQINPGIVIPMHFKTEKCGFPIESVEAFLQGKSGVRRSTAGEVIVHKEDIPTKTTFLYLPPCN